jgi:hypothetical protein
VIECGEASCRGALEKAVADNVDNVTHEILKNIQASIAELGRRFEQHRTEMNERFDQFTSDARKDRRNINGLMTLLQAASGDFDERIRELDDRLSIIEDRAS